MCGNRWRGAIAQSSYMFGVFIGAVSLGSMADKWVGRGYTCNHTDIYKNVFSTVTFIFQLYISLSCSYLGPILTTLVFSAVYETTIMFLPRNFNSQYRKNGFSFINWGCIGKVFISPSRKKLRKGKYQPPPYSYSIGFSRKITLRSGQTKICYTLSKNSLDRI